jgi:Flp pilus assembly protein TadG
VEFALVLPALIALLAALGQVAWLQHCNSSLRYALATSSRALLLNPNLSQLALQDMVRAKLSAADPDVTVTLVVATPASGGKIATLTGRFSHNLSPPMLPAMPLAYQTSVVTPLPAF